MCLSLHIAFSQSKAQPRWWVTIFGRLNEEMLHIDCILNHSQILSAHPPVSSSDCRTPNMSAVHPCDDGCSEDLPLAVYWVQVLQRLRHLGERREFLLCGFPHMPFVFSRRKNVADRPQSKRLLSTVFEEILWNCLKNEFVWRVWHWRTVNCRDCKHVFCDVSL